MNSDLRAKLVDWALVTFSVVVVTYVVTLPLVWFACAVSAYWTGVPPSPELLEAEIWREFVRAELRLPLVLWSWFAFAFGIIALGVCRDIYQSFKAKS